jgi:hypothetical protein
MKRRTIYFLTSAIILVLVLIADFGYSQNAIENLIVETYYIADANDAAHDDEGTNLPEGSVTYRVFLDLAPGYQIKELFGTDRNPWFIRSTELIWNNSDRGVTLGSNLGDNRLDENTVALDSYVTIGAASDAHYGIPKYLDTDGSIVGGENNDGGSESVEGGLLVHANAEIDIPLTTSDGLIEVDESLIPSLSAGLIPSLQFVFSNEINDSVFATTGTSRLQPTTSVSGITEENIILIAQITTLGELEFNFNVVLLDENENPYVFVADSARQDSAISPYLSFPPECGCTDPDYLEYDPAAPCDDGSCETLIVFGCGDPDACNYDPSVNFSIPQLCCYGINDCNGLDWTIICPQLSAEEVRLDFGITAYPNPTRGKAWVEIASDQSHDAELFIYDLQGKVVHREGILIRSGTESIAIPVEQLPAGTYLVRISNEEINETTLLIKN